MFGTFESSLFSMVLWTVSICQDNHKGQNTKMGQGTFNAATVWPSIEPMKCSTMRKGCAHNCQTQINQGHSDFLKHPKSGCRGKNWLVVSWLFVGDFFVCLQTKTLFVTFSFWITFIYFSITLVAHRLSIMLTFILSLWSQGTENWEKLVSRDSTAVCIGGSESEPCEAIVVRNSASIQRSTIWAAAIQHLDLISWEERTTQNSKQTQCWTDKQHMSTRRCLWYNKTQGHLQICPTFHHVSQSTACGLWIVIANIVAEVPVSTAYTVPIDGHIQLCHFTIINFEEGWEIVETISTRGNCEGWGCRAVPRRQHFSS